MKSSEFLKKHRKKANITQNELGALLGYGNGQYISNIERNNSLFPKKKAAELCQILRCDYAKFLHLLKKDYIEKVMGDL